MLVRRVGIVPVRQAAGAFAIRPANAGERRGPAAARLSSANRVEISRLSSALALPDDADELKALTLANAARADQSEAAQAARGEVRAGEACQLTATSSAQSLSALQILTELISSS